MDLRTGFTSHNRIVNAPARFAARAKLVTVTFLQIFNRLHIQAGDFMHKFKCRAFRQ